MAKAAKAKAPKAAKAKAPKAAKAKAAKVSSVVESESSGAGDHAVAFAPRTVRGVPLTLHILECIAAGLAVNVDDAGLPHEFADEDVLMCPFAGDPDGCPHSVGGVCPHVSAEV